MSAKSLKGPMNGALRSPSDIGLENCFAAGVGSGGLVVGMQFAARLREMSESERFRFEGMLAELQLENKLADTGQMAEILDWLDANAASVKAAIALRQVH